MAEPAHRRGAATRAQLPALLKGLIFGPNGRPMSPSHTRRRGRIYRYYVSREAIADGYDTCAVTSVPAPDVEGAVLDHVQRLLAAPELVARTWAVAKREGDEIPEREVMRSLRPQLLLDQRRQLSGPALGCPGDVESLAQLHLRHEQEHHDRGQTLATAPGTFGRTLESSELSGLPAERGAQAVHDQERGAIRAKHEPERPETMLRKRAQADPLTFGPFLGAFSVGIARKRPRRLRITAPSSKARMICGAFV
jgi:Recombinase zinc beta ribbon domain